MAKTLYLVGTPIGNLEDITLRALRVLREVRVIACESSQRVLALLNAHGIPAKGKRFLKLNEGTETPAQVERVLKILEEEDVALVSNAGNPCVSDPGFKTVRAAWERGFRVVPVPGPSAFVAAVMASGLPTDRIAFEGFLPRTKGKRLRRVEELKSEPRTIAIYVPKRKLREYLQELAEAMPDREAVLFREITKLHEERLAGTLRQLAEAQLPEKGEFVLLIRGAK